VTVSASVLSSDGRVNERADTRPTKHPPNFGRAHGGGWWGEGGGAKNYRACENQASHRGETERANGSVDRSEMGGVALARGWARPNTDARAARRHMGAAHDDVANREAGRAAARSPLDLVTISSRSRHDLVTISSRSRHGSVSSSSCSGSTSSCSVVACIGSRE
jgi:hypothetical protein